MCNLCVLCSVRVWCGVGFYPGHRESGGGFFWDPPVIGAAEQPKPQKETRGESQFSTLFFFQIFFFFFFPSKCVCVCGFLASWARSSCYISELFWRTTTATTLRCCWRIRCIILDERLFLSLSLISRAADDYCNNKPFGNLRPPAEGVGSERTWREETTSHAR